MAPMIISSSKELKVFQNPNLKYSTAGEKRYMNVLVTKMIGTEKTMLMGFTIMS